MAILDAMKEQKMRKQMQTMQKMTSTATAAAQQGDPRALRNRISQLETLAAGTPDIKQSAAIMEQANNLRSMLPQVEKLATGNSANAVMAIDKHLRQLNQAGPLSDRELLQKQVFERRRAELMNRPEVATAYRTAMDEMKSNALKLQKQELDVQKAQAEQALTQKDNMAKRWAVANANNPDAMNQIPAALADQTEEIGRKINAIRSINEEAKTWAGGNEPSQMIKDLALNSDSPIVKEALRKIENKDYLTTADRDAQFEIIRQAATDFAIQMEDAKKETAEALAPKTVDSLISLSGTEGFLDARTDFWEKVRHSRDGDDTELYDMVVEVAKANPDMDLEQLGLLVLTEFGIRGEDVAAPARDIVDGVNRRKAKQSFKESLGEKGENLSEEELEVLFNEWMDEQKRSRLGRNPPRNPPEPQRVRRKRESKYGR